MEPTAISPAAPPERPKWLDDTPEVLYTLEMFIEETVQQVKMNLEEYELLKTYLAKLRGVQLDAEEEAQLAQGRIA